MSVYESISRASLKTKRRLFDYNVSILGQKMKAIRISYKEDMFQDIEIQDTISTSILEAIIRFPTEMPLERYRLGYKSEVDETRTYFYDILPIESYTKLEDHIEKNDFLFFFLEDEKNNKIPYLFQVTDSFGKFEIGLVWKKQYLAPYHGQLTNQIIKYLEEYVISKEYDQFKEENPDSGYLLNLEEQEEYLHEAYKNLFVSPLSPRNQEIVIDSPTTIQCAFGSIDVLGQRVVTPETPLLIVPEEETTLYLVVSEDCKYPSVYASEYFHPFTLDKKDVFAIEEVFSSDLTASFTLDLSFMTKSGISPIIFIDDNGTFLSDEFLIFGDYDYQKFRPIFYVEDSTGKFISIRVKENYELELIAKVSETTVSHLFGSVEGLETIPFNITVSGNNLEIHAIDSNYLLESVDIFFGRTFYLGYEPDRYLNDFIRQIFI